MESETLRYVTPYSFTVGIEDKSDSRGNFVLMKIGSERSERDSLAEQSGTQETLAYPFNIGSIRVRLIDTPGIGVTGGFEKYDKNMADILGILRSYNKLHCILILLESDVARLPARFQDFIKQVLTHLHRDAANNIVFHITKSRRPYYMPGDTFESLLETLLKECKGWR
jgi:hypothetical protein